MRLFVVGKLGEVIKKIIELEDVLRENPTNQILVAELASYNEVVRMWPIHDDVIMHQAMDIFRLNIEKLKLAEQELRSTGIGDPFMFMVMTKYFKYLDLVRSDLSTINELGMHVGPSPYMEVVDANVEQLAAQHPDPEWQTP
jgi:hypothetical protein